MESLDRYGDLHRLGREERSWPRWDAVDLKAGTITVKQRADERGVIGSPAKKASSRRTDQHSLFRGDDAPRMEIESNPGAACVR